MPHKCTKKHWKESIQCILNELSNCYPKEQDACHQSHKLNYVFIAQQDCKMDFLTQGRKSEENAPINQIKQQASEGTLKKAVQELWSDEKKNWNTVGYLEEKYLKIGNISENKQKQFNVLQGHGCIKSWVYLKHLWPFI